MKKAIQYIRISTSDQSNWSIDAQQKINELFATKHKLDIVDTFIDDGVSAKNFDRPQWNLLEKRLKKEKSIYAVIVTKYDRLIRNAMQALQFLDRCETAYGVRIYSATEHFEIDTYSPMFFKIRTDLLVNAEFERRTISARTQMGNWAARSQGRYIGPAPFGYTNERDAANKPIISINEDRAHIIKYIFDAWCNKIPLAHIKETAKRMGFTNKHKSAIQSVIKNQTYAGLIKVAAYKDEGEKIIIGNHDAIISKELFEKANGLLTNQKQTTTLIQPELPLRGLLRCLKCGEVMTGSASKGRSATYYYYRCKPCKKVNLNGRQVDAHIIDILSQLSLSDDIVDRATKKLISKIDKIASKASQNRKKLRSKITLLHSRIDQLEQKYFDEDISSDVYKKWNRKYGQEMAILNSDLDYYSKDFSGSTEKIAAAMPRFKQLEGVYDNFDTTSKHQLISLLFGNQLFTGKNDESNHLSRTASLHPLILPKSNNISGFEILNRKEILKEYKNFQFVPEAGVEPARTKCTGF